MKLAAAVTCRSSTSAVECLSLPVELLLDLAQAIGEFGREANKK